MVILFYIKQKCLPVLYGIHYHVSCFYSRFVKKQLTNAPIIDKIQKLLWVFRNYILAPKGAKVQKEVHLNGKV